MLKKFLFVMLIVFLLFPMFPMNNFASASELKVTDPSYLLKEATGEGVKVAVIDSGIAPHPDLTIAGGKNFISSGQSYTDDNNHGTMVAGIIAGKKYGVAPDVELYALKVLNQNARGYSDDMEEAVEWSIENDIDIINMSIIMDYDNYWLNKTIKKAIEHGIIVVACAGNNGKAVTNPANVDHVLSVGALNSDWETKASFSSYIGRVDYWARGNNITSTNRFGSYDSNWYGTSFSAPYVTGIFALYKEAFPNATADELKQLVSAHAKPLKSNPDWKVPQKPQYEERAYLKFKTVKGRFIAEREVRYYPVSNIKIDAPNETTLKAS